MHCRQLEIPSASNLLFLSQHCPLTFVYNLQCVKCSLKFCSFSRLQGAEVGENKAWSHPYHPPWSPDAPFTFAWEKESSSLNILNLYRPIWMGSDTIGDQEWLNFCPDKHIPCIEPYCPFVKEGKKKKSSCVGDGWSTETPKDHVMWFNNLARKKHWIDKVPKLKKPYIEKVKENLGNAPKQTHRLMGIEGE